MIPDFTTTLSLSITAIISLVSIFFLFKPFLVAALPDSATFRSSTELDKKLHELDSTSNRNLMLDSLEELEMSRVSGMLSQQEYLEQKDLLLKDAATKLNKD